MANQEEITIHRAETAGIEVPVDIPIEIKERGLEFIDNYIDSLRDFTEGYRKRLTGAMAKTESGVPVLAGGFQYWNCLTVGPIQFYANPPYRPSKIIAAGEWALMLGIVWVNPADGPGGGLSGTVVLGGRNYRVRFETMNLSDVANGPDQGFLGTFASPANVINVFPWWLNPADPGANPNLYETSLTADIVETGQPMAAFSTWHLDLDREPAFMGVPLAPEHLQFEIPARFLVYRK